MSNISPEEMRNRGEMLKRAKQILIQEYTAVRSQQHQQWIKNSENVWRTKGILIAYPPGKLFPSEQEIVNKALELYNRSMLPTEVLADSPAIPAQDISEVEPIITMSAYDAEPVSITEQLQAAYNTFVPTNVVETSVVTEVQPTLPASTDLVQAGGDFVIIDEPIESEDSIPEVEPIIEGSEGESVPVKHSLLRSVLSGWLSKNKDKDVS
jgi:hypothetical protein